MKRFIIEVEEGEVPSCGICPFGVHSGMCYKYGYDDNGLLNCNKYDLTTLIIKEERK